MGRKRKAAQSSSTPAESSSDATSKKIPEDNKNHIVTRVLPKRAAACRNYKDKSVRSSKSDKIQARKDHEVEEELEAIALTGGPSHPRTNKRLTDFVLHDENGIPQPVEMLEASDIFISGLILPLEESTDKEKEKGIRCSGFGRVESWSISGYEEGSPVIWVSTEMADYDCGKPAKNYKKIYGLFYEKANACIVIYKKLSRSHGGDPSLSFDDLLMAVVQSMRGSKNFPQGFSVREFIVSHGEFIYNQLIGLDETCKENDLIFSGLPSLTLLRDEGKKSVCLVPGITVPRQTGIKIEEGGKGSSSGLIGDGGCEGEDIKLARLLQEQEAWESMAQKKKPRTTALSKKYYIKINEDEIANDYPDPEYYKSSNQETDEYIIFDDTYGANYSDELPRSTLHNWAFYNSDSRLISLELLPMKPCADIDVAIFGSGTMSEDDGTGFCLDEETNQASSCGGINDEGIPLYLSAIKEWMIEFGSSMIFITVRTDMAWYRLGRPSKQYLPWHEAVLKTARLAISIITLLKEQARVSRLCFSDVIKKLSEFEKDHPSYISSNQDTIERYVVVHGQIILQLFSEYPDDAIRKSAFVIGLNEKMEQKHHTKWLVKAKTVLNREGNLNPRAQIAPVVSKRVAMPATTTRLVHETWGAFYLNGDEEDPETKGLLDVKEDDADEAQADEDDDNQDSEENEIMLPIESDEKPQLSLQENLHSSNGVINWDGEASATYDDKVLYRQAKVGGTVVSVGGFVLVKTTKSEPSICLIEYLFANSSERKMAHGRVMLKGSQTVLGDTANEREVFMTSNCLEFDLSDILQIIDVEIRLRPWGFQYRKENAILDQMDRDKAEERKNKGLPMQYFCKSLYSPDKGAFFSLQRDTFGLGTGICQSCETNRILAEKEVFRINSSSTGFTYMGVEYYLNDFVYLSPFHFEVDKNGPVKFKGGRNVGSKAYVVGQLLEIEPHKTTKKVDPGSRTVKLRRFYRPEDISSEKAYRSDIREVYYSEETVTLPITAIEGICEVRKMQDAPAMHSLGCFEHIFYCYYFYDHNSGAIKKLSPNIKLSYSKTTDQAANRKKKGKSKEGVNDFDDAEVQKMEQVKNPLATLDIFAGCGGLSTGLQLSGASQTKWAIEYEAPAGEAFRLNHPDATVIVNNCNVILRAIMDACGDSDECISTPEADELANKLEKEEIDKLPRPGQVDFINGGPPCQGFSGMNRFNTSTWSKIQCEMILAFLSFADYFRPKYFLLENVRNFVSFNKGQTFHLTLRSLLEMGYQVRFGILEAGTFGVSQSRKRAFIWAAAPNEKLPDWPEPMHVFSVPELKVSLNNKTQYAAVRSTANGAPFRAITVRDAIGDLPVVSNGASETSMEYVVEPISWFQKMIRGKTSDLTDHIAKEMNELNLIRCKRISRRPGADWRELPDEKVRLSNGQIVDLIPWCLPNTAIRHNQWKGLFGRLDWEGNFPTSITDPQPMGKVGLCFHPEQDRIVTVRECARSQGFPDSYLFDGNIQHKHRQIGNAVPPPLAFALGRKLKEAIEGN
ncbi:DNA (cytosine-5)-methyltransferase 1-like isoform X2 [Impatiens glandulifera]|nr:DNA (cytosine-5)-methyltransferase 1-like isoform X2 [Impatiens glandulifera]